MTRTVFALVALLGGTTGSAHAETLPLFEGVPATYTPGTPFQFLVRVPVLTDFTGFSVDLIFSTEVANPPLFVSSAPVPVAPGGRYVFPSNATFQSGSSLVGGSSEVVLTFTDTTPSPVVTQTGVSDTLAIVTVRPGATLTGSITISYGTDSNFAINSELNYPPPNALTVAQAGLPPVTNPVPAPAGALLLGLGGLILGARKRLARPAR